MDNISGSSNVPASGKPARRPRPQVIRLTERAAARVTEILANGQNDQKKLRIGVKNGGCAGMSYTMSLVDEVAPFDELIEDKGVTLYIESKAVLFLFGSEMDYQTGRLSSGFTFNNPNQTGACGCGESVSLTAARLPDDVPAV